MRARRNVWWSYTSCAATLSDCSTYGLKELKRKTTRHPLVTSARVRLVDRLSGAQPSLPLATNDGNTVHSGRVEDTDVVYGMDEAAA